MPLPLNPHDEQIVLKTLGQERDRLNQFKAVASPDLAERVGGLRKRFPSAAGGVLLSAAKAGLPDAQVEAIVAASDGVEPPKKKSLWQKTVSGFKTGTRFGFAGLEFSLQAAQNVGAKTFGANDGFQPTDLLNILPNYAISGAIGDEGFMVSTDLGATLTGRDTGEGFFFGGEAKQFQGEMVKAYRGTTTGGHAWSYGRGTAGMVFKEGSVPYNLASGFVDGAIALAIPATPIKPVAEGVKGLAAVQDAGEIVKGLDYGLDVVRGKGVAVGLSKISGAEYENARIGAGVLNEMIDPKLVNDYIGTRKGIRLMERLVEAKTATEVRKLVGENVYPETIQRLRNAATFNDVRKEVIDILGLPVAGIARSNVAGARLIRPSNARRINVIDNLVGRFEDSRAGLIADRAFTARPTRAIVDFSSDNPVDVRRSLNDIERWLKVSLADPADHERFMDQALDAMTGPLATPSARRKLKDDFNGLIQKSWVENGVNEDVAAAVMGTYGRGQNAARSFNVSLSGELDDAGFYMGMNGKGMNVADGVLGGPTLQSELGSFMVEMPDVAQVRALTGRINTIWRKSPNAERFADDNIERLSKAGELRMPLALVQGLQERLFRRVILATGGFSLRNLLEGQMSLALSQKPVTSLFRHPFQHLQWAAHGSTTGSRFGGNLGKIIGRKGVGDILGEEFTDVAAIAAMRDYQHAVGVSISSNYSNPADVYRRGRRLGEFNDVRRGTADVQRVVEAHGDQIGKMNQDPVMRMLVDGSDDNEVLNFIRTDPEGQKWFRDQQDYHMGGRPVFDKTTNRWSDTPQVIDLRNGHNLRLLVQELKQRRDLVVGGHDALSIAVKTGLLPPVTVDVRALGWDESFRGTVQQVPTGKGKNFFMARVDANDESIVRPFAFDKGESTKQLKELLGRPDVLTDPALAQVLTHETRLYGKVERGRQLGQEADHMMDVFFGFISQKPTAYLERSVPFRQRYYTWAIDEMITSLSPADLDTMVARITEKAANLGITPSQYVGDNGDLADQVVRLFKTPTSGHVGDRWARILDLQANPTKLKGTLTLKEVDLYAKGAASDDLKKMLYDASERNNITDVSRAVVPFGQATLEFFRRMGRTYTVETAGIPLPNLNALRKTQFMIENGREADPDGNGRGFFYKDPQTGDMMFDYPLSSNITKWMTGLLGGGPGVSSTLSAPLKGAVLGFQAQVGFGPVAQIAASTLLLDIPALDFVRRAVMPYGETDLTTGGVVEQFLPSWAKKFMSAFLDSPESATTYGNTFFEVYEVLGASGEYDLSNPNERDRMWQDAKPKAQALTVVRAVGQFLGPSRPSHKFSIETKEGNILLNVLSQDFREMEVQDRDTAVPRFLDKYGENMLSVLMHKTKPTVGGLQASIPFGNFELTNPNLFRKYKEVAGFFIEGGTDFDWIVYGRQLKLGKRVRLSPEDSLLAAQSLVAYSSYRVAQELVGSNPTDEQAAALRDYRVALGKKYTGFTMGVVEVNKMENTVRDLRNAIKEPGMDKNPVALAVTEYLSARDATFEAAKGMGLAGLVGSKKAAGLRGVLRGEGERIKAKYPDFARLYDYLLRQEIDE